MDWCWRDRKPETCYMDTDQAQWFFTLQLILNIFKTSWIFVAYELKSQNTNTQIAESRAYKLDSVQWKENPNNELSLSYAQSRPWVFVVQNSVQATSITWKINRRRIEGGLQVLAHSVRRSALSADQDGGWAVGWVQAEGHKLWEGRTREEPPRRCWSSLLRLFLVDKIQILLLWHFLLRWLHPLLTRGHTMELNVGDLPGKIRMLILDFHDLY